MQVKLIFIGIVSHVTGFETKSLPVAPSGAKATNKHPPVITVLGQSLQFSPRVAISPHVCLKVTAPRVSWPAPLPFALRVPGEGLPCDVG